MEIPKVILGNTGLTVSKLGFGTAYLGAPSLDISPEEGADILQKSYMLGVNFWDASDDYGSHIHVASALKRIPRDRVVISTKTRAKNGKTISAKLKECLNELETDYVDIFMLHEVTKDQSAHISGVLKELEAAKLTGTIKAVGMSTHSVAVASKSSGRAGRFNGNLLQGRP